MCLLCAGLRSYLRLLFLSSSCCDAGRAHKNSAAQTSAARRRQLWRAACRPRLSALTDTGPADSCRHPAPRCTAETPGRHTGFLPPPPPSQSVSQSASSRSQHGLRTFQGQSDPVNGITAENLSTVRTANCYQCKCPKCPKYELLRNDLLNKISRSLHYNFTLKSKNM